jgi:hypothetical protein
MSKMSELDADRQQIERLTGADDTTALRVSHRRQAKLEYALAEIISISRDNRITQIALRAIDVRELV